MLYILFLALGAAGLALDQWLKATMTHVTPTSSHRLPEKLDQAAP